MIDLDFHPAIMPILLTDQGEVVKCTPAEKRLAESKWRDCDEAFLLEFPAILTEEEPLLTMPEPIHEGDRILRQPNTLCAEHIVDILRSQMNAFAVRLLHALNERTPEGMDEYEWVEDGYVTQGHLPSIRPLLSQLALIKKGQGKRWFITAKGEDILRRLAQREAKGSVASPSLDTIIREAMRTLRKEIGAMMEENQWQPGVRRMLRRLLSRAKDSFADCRNEEEVELIRKRLESAMEGIDRPSATKSAA